jgi:DeoR/GlpR family transcriptional regulator of sugar metabolism
MQQHLPEKRAIARRAASLVESGQTVLLDTGSTTQLIARELTGRTDLQIVTNSLAVGYELRGALGVSLIVLGGCARPGGIELVGPFTERLLGEIRADIAFLGADAVDAARGFYTTDPGVARVEELMIESAACAVVTATADKLGRRSFVRYACFDAVDRWITCGDISAADRESVSAHIEIDDVSVEES